MTTQQITDRYRFSAVGWNSSKGQSLSTMDSQLYQKNKLAFKKQKLLWPSAQSNIKISNWVQLRPFNSIKSVTKVATYLLTGIHYQILVFYFRYVKPMSLFEVRWFNQWRIRQVEIIFFVIICHLDLWVLVRSCSLVELLPRIVHLLPRREQKRLMWWSIIWSVIFK